MNHIRHDFERAMINHSERLNEASEREYMILAQSTQQADKDKLFNLINQDLFGGKTPFKRMTLNKFDLGSMAKVEKELNKNANAANALVLLGGDTTGIGRGEIMLAYIVENLCIGGGSEDIDLSLFNKTGKIMDQAELKEVSKSNDGFLKDWRTGAKHRPYVEQAKADLRTLYDGLKDVIPELNINTASGKDIASKVARDEGALFLNFARDIDPVEIMTPLQFEIEEIPTGELIIKKIGGGPLGALEDKKTIDTIRGILKGQNMINLKSYKNIEAELAKGFGSIKEKFVFIHTIGTKKKFGGIYFKNNLSGSPADTKIDAWTGGTVKVKVKA